MIEKILNLAEKKVEVEKLEKFKEDDLKKIRDEIKLISNFTPIFTITHSSPHKRKIGKEINGIDALWAHVNIALASKS